MRSEQASRLGRCFREALAFVGASELLLGCAGPVVAPTSATLPLESGFQPVTCRPAAETPSPWPPPALLAGLRPAIAVDYLELDFGGGEVLGTPCGAAADPSRCLSELEAIELSWFASSERLETDEEPARCWLRGTRGDEVVYIGSVQRLLSFLGPVDTLAEAELLLLCRHVDFPPPWFYRATAYLDCDRSGGVERPDGYDVLLFTQEGCEGRSRHRVHVDRAGNVSVLDTVNEARDQQRCILGRRPEGFRGSGEAPKDLGAFFARSAELEAASVPAFLRLARELRAHGAPPALVRRALHAARDEVRHAQVTTQFARACGDRPTFAAIPVGGVRSLEQVAHENASEGCVLETHAALLAHHQAIRARTHRLRCVYASIAHDETRHAALAWDVACWADTRLTEPARRRVAAARARATFELQSSLAHATKQRADTAVGLPTPDAAVAMARALEVALWRG